MENKTLLIDHTRDCHTQAVKDKLRFEHDWIDLVQALEDNVEWEVTYVNGKPQSKIFLDSATYDLSKYRAVLSRFYVEKKYYSYKEGQGKVRDIFSRFRDQQQTVVFESLAEIFSQCVWVGESVYKSYNSNKIIALKVASELGFKIPETLVSSSPNIVRNFFEHHGRQIIYKPISFFDFEGIKIRGEKHSFNARVKLIDDASIEDVLKRCIASPTIFQKYVDKQYELRITFIGDIPYICGIDSQNSPDGKYDWRVYDMENTRWFAADCPRELIDRCRKYIAKMNVNFGSFDIIYSTDGDYYFLEMNTMPQWLWIQQEVGLPIAQGIASYLEGWSCDSLKEYIKSFQYVRKFM